MYVYEAAKSDMEMYYMYIHYINMMIYCIGGRWKQEYWQCKLRLRIDINCNIDIFYI